MAALDQDDPRPPFQQLASVIRAAILTKKYGPGDQLPSGNEMARTYGVSRATVQDALRVLKNEGLIVVRAGTRRLRARAHRAAGRPPDAH